jgi:phosphate transport system permease protein
VRATIKPSWRSSPACPTVVYGFFAVLTVSPFAPRGRPPLGIDMVSPNAALAAGFVMGIMIIPFISSLADDASTPCRNRCATARRAMGATKSETIRQVLLPAALPGIMGGILLASAGPSARR